jgi:hypothetical protein
MEQKPTPFRVDSGAAFQPVFQHGQRTGPGEQFRKDSPNKTTDV